MIILGLTGSIGMGKTTTAAMFRDKGISIYNADKTVHQLYQNEAVEYLREEFPDAIVNKKIDREILSSLVLGNPEKLQLLESIIHPLVRKKQTEFIQNAKVNGEKLVVLDIPLLFETGGDKSVDKIVVVTADPSIQRERVLARSNMTAEKFNSIINRQVSDVKKRDKADFIIDTGKGIKHAQQRVTEIIRHLTE